MEDSYLEVSSEDYSRELREINPSDVLVPMPASSGRIDTEKGLGASVRDFGVLSPINVMTSSAEEGKYILVEGFRRLRAALAYQKETIPAYVWDFKDKDKGSDLRTILGLEINRSQRRTWKEKWNLYQVLQDCDVDVPYEGRERLLDMEPGDSHKLEDVMGSNSFPEVQDALMNGDKDLDGAFKMLLKLRKDQDRGALEEEQGASALGVEDAENDTPKLSDDELKAILNADDSGDITDDEFGGDPGDGLYGDDYQKVGERHPLDPALRTGVLARDDFRCQCCGFGGTAALGILAVHHVVPVHAGGPDKMDNLTTLCLNHHILVHLVERGGGKLQITKEEFEKYTKEEQEALRKAVELGRKAIRAAKAKGMTKEQVMEASRDSIRHPMPGAGLKENQESYVEAKRNG